MKYLALLILTISATLSIARTSNTSNYEKLSQIRQLDRFSFGSCNKEYLEMNLWGQILADQPQLFMWGGDNIYGDKGDNVGNLREKYNQQNSKVGYQELKRRTPIIGIWDDHDYGINDAGAENPNKEENKHHLLDFLEVPLNAAVRHRDGIYQDYTFGTNNKVKFIMLDNRYNLTKDNVLGENQWHWLEEQLKISNAKIHFIVGGISIIGAKVPKSNNGPTTLVSNSA